MKSLIIPDIHEDCGFLKQIFQAEAPSDYDRIILLGDYFDTSPHYLSTTESIRETACAIKSLKKSFPHKVVLLCGNHDLPYYALRPACINDSNEFNAELSFSLNNGPSHNYKIERARIINSLWDEIFWQNLKGAYLFDGWLFSHAGIKPKFWRKTDSPETSYELFSMGWQSAWENMHNTKERNAFFSCGTVRGGESEHGGPLWLDWRKEFSDELELPQIVGHTRLSSENEMQKGRSYCLDFSQRAYAKLIDGKLTLIQLKIRTYQSYLSSILSM